jgi:hypothetical protein
MKQNRIAMLMACAFWLNACSNEKQAEYDSSLGPQINKDSTASNASTGNAAISADTAGKAQTLSIDTTKTASVGGLNPAHGQPGHRCDIAVGAPLNSAPSKPATPTTATATPTTTTVTPAPVTKTAPGMNPAHGQPGHRCDIAVGAPLNSAPPKPATTTTTTVAPTVTPSTDPVTKEQLLKQQENNKNKDIVPEPTTPVLQTTPEVKKGG